MDTSLKVDMSYDIVEQPNEKVEEVSPFDVIKAIAEKMGQDISDPNPSCKDCYGRGYIGRDASNKAPIPCRCIYGEYDSTLNDMMTYRMRPKSRKERRLQERQYRKMLKRGMGK